MKNRMIKIGMALALTLTFLNSGWAAVEHKHDPAFGKRCAYSVMHGEFDVNSKDDFLVTYKKKTYFFSTEEARDKFIENIRPNVKKARSAWLKKPLYDRK